MNYLICCFSLSISLFLAPSARAGAENIEHYIDAASQYSGLHPGLIKAVIKTESNFNGNAISPKGAISYMQLMPNTARELGVDPYNAWENIYGGATYLKNLLVRYGYNLRLALAAYNAGPGRVVDKIPDFPETQNYVATVMSRYAKFANQSPVAYEGARHQNAAEFYKDVMPYER